MRLTVNGQPRTVEPRAEQSLLHVLREQLGLTAAKPGCGEGACGACTVLVDGQPVHACTRLALETDGRDVSTLEGLGDERVWQALITAFVDTHAFQCGYCTPGMVVTAGALLRSNSSPSRAEIVEALDGNVCRCGTYPRIIRAVEQAAASLGSAASVVQASADAAGGREDDVRFTTGAGVPWDLAEPSERDWFERLGDGLVVVLTGDETERVNQERGGAWSTEGGAWLHMSPGGHVTAFTGKVDVGQDNSTMLTTVVADWLRLPYDSVELIMGDTDFCPYDIGTFGSRSTEDAGGVLAAVAATARKWLEANGGRVAEGAHDVVFATADAANGTPHAVEAGDGHARRRAQAIADGSLLFTTDFSLPGMLNGQALHSPVNDAAALDVDLAAATALPEVTTVQQGSFMGVVAPDESRAAEAAAAINVRWPASDLPSENDLVGYLRSHPIEEQGWEGGFEHEQGSVERAMESAAATLSATYTTPYLAHVPLETRCAVATWDGERVTVWTGTQRPFGVREQVAAELAISEEQVRVIVPPTGGGYGGKHTVATAVEAARLSRGSGKPVKVRWSRGTEFESAYFRPAAVIDVKAALNDRGRLVAWEFRNTNSGPMAIRPPYDVPNQRLIYQPADSPLRQGSYRALAATANNFARESAMDELAHLAGADPLEFRLQHLHDDRLAHVLQMAAERGGWHPRGMSADRAVGIACGVEKGSRIATLVEVSLPKVGELKVTRIVAAYDCGAIKDGDNLRNQVEGALVMGLGGALFEAVHFDNGRITNGSMKAYRVPRFSDVPPVEVVLVDRPDEPSVGAGETPIIAIAPAIANALFSLTGERRRSLPLLAFDP